MKQYKKSSVPWHALLLGLIFLYGMRLRDLWFQKAGGLYCKGTNCDVDGYLEMSVQLWSGNWEALAKYRPTQLLYPLLLSPIHLFQLSASDYVYVLHGILTFGTLVFVYLSGKRLHSKMAGLCAAFLIANHANMVTWFNWMFTEYLYYFLISAFIYFTICCYQAFSLTKFFLLCLYFIPLFGTKPESSAAFFPAFVMGVYLVLTLKKWTPLKAKSAITVSILFCLVSLVTLISVSEPFQKKVFSHLHVAHGLWLSTHTGEVMNDTSQGLAYEELSRWIQDKHFTTLPEMQEAMSREGLRLIQLDPVRHIRHIGKRFVATLYTWGFAVGWTKEMKRNDAIYTLFITLGSLLFFLFYGEGRRDIQVIFYSAISMLLFVAVYHLDGDFKFRLPIHIPLTILGASGWVECFASLFSLSKNRSAARKVNIA